MILRKSRCVVITVGFNLNDQELYGVFKGVWCAHFDKYGKTDLAIKRLIDMKTKQIFGQIFGN